MSEQLNSSPSRTHILDKGRRNEVVINRKETMVEVLTSKVGRSKRMGVIRTFGNHTGMLIKCVTVSVMPTGEWG